MARGGGDAGCAVAMILIVVIANCIFFPPLIYVVLGVSAWFLLPMLFGKGKEGKSLADSHLPVKEVGCDKLKVDVITRFDVKGMLKTYGADVEHLVRGGEILLLQREPANVYDSNAILAVAESGAKIGYVAKEVAKRLAPKMAAGEKFAVRVVPVSYSEWNYGKCSVELLSDEELKSLENRVMVTCSRCEKKFDAANAKSGDLLWCPVCHMAHKFYAEPCASLKPHYFFGRSSDADAIAEFARERDIRRILHFTSFPSLLSIFRTGFVMSRSAMDEYADAHPDSRVDFHSNDAGRWDMRLNCINMSIERANTKLLWVMQQRDENRGREPWCILEIDPVCMEKEGVYFATSNAASAYVRKHGTRSGVDGLKDLFADSITSGRQVDGGLPETYVVSRDASAPLNRPTDGQAEVLVPGSITTELIKRIICRSQDDMSRVCMELSRIVAGKLPEIVVSPLEFDDYEPSWQRERPGHWRR